MSNEKEQMKMMQVTKMIINPMMMVEAVQNDVRVTKNKTKYLPNLNVHIADQSVKPDYQ